MGVYEDLLRRKKILEDEKGNVTVNSVVDKTVRDKLTDNKLQTYNRQDSEFYNNFVNETKNIITSNVKRSIWDTVKQFASDTGKTVENGWLSLVNGTRSSAQTIGRAISNTQVDRADFWNKENEKMLKKRAEQNSGETEKINKIINNPLISGNRIRQSTEEVTKKIDEKKEEYVKKMQENTASIDNKVGKYIAGNIVPAIGQMLPGMVGGGVGTTYFISSATGNYYDDAKQRGMNEEQATLYSGTMGMIEGSLETLGAKLTTNVGKQLLKKNIKGALVNYGLDIGENFLEEAIVEPISELVAQTTAGKEKADWNDVWKRALQSGIDGAVTSMITGGASGIIGGVASKTRSNKYIDINTNKKLDKNAQGVLQKAEKVISDNNINDLQQNAVQKQEVLLREQITQQENIMPQNGNMGQINSRTLPIRNYQYVETSNSKINNLRQDMSKYWTDTNETKALGSVIEKVIEDKGYNVRLDNSLTRNGQIANAQIRTLDNGEVEIRINPNAKNVGEFLLMHEVTHAVGTQEMKDLVINYASKNNDFNEALEGLKKSYNTSELSDEVLADVSGQLFGNQEFINSLVMENTSQSKSFIKKVYETIKRLLNSITEEGRYKNFVQDLEIKWRQAYQTQINNLNNNTYYSIQTDNNGKQYVKVDTDQNIFEGKSPKEYTKIAKEYILNKFRNEGKKINLPTKEDIKVIRRTAEEYTHPKNKLSYSKKDSKMRASTELDNLVKISEYQYSRQDDGRHSFAKDGWDYYKTIFEVNGKTFEGLVNIGKNGTQRTLYDITNIKEMPHISYGKNLPESVSASPSINNSILLTKKNVNSSINNDSMQNIQNNTSENSNKSSFSLQENKQKQLEIIQNSNPMQDDYHTGIRTIDDIKTLSEVLQDEDWIDYEEINPDLTRTMLNEALESGKITVYSSYPIKQGVFVSPSYMEAESYSGNGKVYSKEVDVNNVAWIDPTQGQYAKVEGIKNSLPTKEWSQHLKDNYKASGTRTDLQDIKLPTRNKVIRDDGISAQNQSLDALTNQINEEEKLYFSEDKKKQRKHYKSIMESQYTTDEARAISKELMGLDTYIPESNNQQLQRADQRIQISGADSELDTLVGKSIAGENIKADDIAVGERLIQYYSLTGDKVRLQEAIQATAMAGTTAGQTVQAMALLNHQTPEGQAVWVQRSVEKMNNDLKKKRGEKAEQFNLTPEMLEKITSSKDNEQLKNNLNEVYGELGQQVSKTVWQKIDSWRYFAMLANPRTHIRNIVGNTAMGQTQQIKNKIAGVIESVVSKVNPEMERNHTIVLASKEVKDFAKNDIVNVADRLGLNENKYNPKTRLENSMRTFKSNILESTIGKAFSLNDNLLEAEDGFGLKAGYKKALSEYMTANKLTPENITDKQLARARNYAVEQAKEATFHQESKMASLINQLSNKNKFAKYATDAMLPFVKTPINVAKSGVNYSPVGLAKSMIFDTAKLRKGDITVNQYIDNISKGLTGTGIALVGYALANMGILKASGSDDKKKEKFDVDRGYQSYSIQIGDKTYSLDWLSPTGIPLFIGAELSEIASVKKEERKSSSTDGDSKYNQVLESGTNLLNAMTSSMNPMTEMSMLSGLTSALSSYEQGSNQMLASIGTNAVKSYVNQFVPTALGQIARTTDDYERTTTSTKSGMLPRAVDTAKNQIMSKVPGLRQKLPTRTDIWGKNIKQEESFIKRALNSAIVPWSTKQIFNNVVDESLTELYKKTGESSVLPKTLDKTFTINSNIYRLTGEEYSEYKKQYGEISYNLLDSLIKTSEYKNMTSKQQKKAVEEIYSYAKEKNKVDYAKKVKEEYETSTVYNTLESLNKQGGDLSQYLSFIGKTFEVEKDVEKNQVLANSDYTLATKSIIYKNTMGKDDSLYNIVLKDSNIDINEYLNYKIKSSNDEFLADKDENGNSISGSAKKKVYDYVKSSISEEGSRLLIFGNQYKLVDSDRKQLVKYIKSNYSTKDALEVYKKLTKNFEVKDGEVYYK